MCEIPVLRMLSKKSTFVFSLIHYWNGLNIFYFNAQFLQFCQITSDLPVFIFGFASFVQYWFLIGHFVFYNVVSCNNYFMP